MVSPQLDLPDTIAGKRRHIAPWPFPTVTLAMAESWARDRLYEHRKGVNPLEEKEGGRSALIAAEKRSMEPLPRAMKELSDRQARLN